MSFSEMMKKSTKKEQPVEKKSTGSFERMMNPDDNKTVEKIPKIESKINLNTKIVSIKNKLENNNFLKDYLYILDFKFSNLKETTKKEIYVLLDNILKTTDESLILGYLTTLQGITGDFEAKKEETIGDSKEKTYDLNWQSKIEKIKNIEIIGEYKGGTWEDFKNVVIDELEIKDENEKKQIIKLLEENYKGLYEKTKGKIDLEEIDSVLNNMLDSLIKTNSSGEVILEVKTTKIAKIINFAQKWGNKGTNFLGEYFNEPDFIGLIDKPLNTKETKIKFSSREEALETIKATKEFLKEIESINWNDLLWKITKTGFSKTIDGIWFIDKKFYSVIKKDLELTFDNDVIGLILGIPANIIALVYLKKFFDKAKTGIDDKKFIKLVDNIDETIKIYKEAGLEKIEIENLNKLKSDIEGYTPEKEGARIDPSKRLKYTYAVLQAFRGNTIADYGRFTSANVGNLLDGDLFGGDLKQLEKIPVLKYLFNNKIGEKITNSKILNFIVRLHLLPLKFLAISVNKGPDGKLGGWAFQTKSDVVNNYIESFDKINKKFKTIFSIIESIDEFNTEEKKEIKNQILKEYKGDITNTKYDPLKKYKFNLSLLTSGEKQEIFYKLEQELKSQGNNIKIKNTLDFLKNINKLEKGKIKIIGNLLVSLNPFENIDRITSEIIEGKIKNKFGENYNPNIKKFINNINNDLEGYIKNRESIENKNIKILDFVKYYPDITNSQEKVLEQVLKIENKINKTPEKFEKSIIEKINKLGINASKDLIDKWETIFEQGGKGINTKDQKIKDLQGRLFKILNNLGLDDTVFNKRKEIIQNIFLENKTLWKPHFIKILDKSLKGEDFSNIKYTDLNPTNNSIETFLGEIETKYNINEEKVITNDEKTKKFNDYEFKKVKPSAESKEKIDLPEEYRKLQSILDPLQIELTIRGEAEKAKEVDKLLDSFRKNKENLKKYIEGNLDYSKEYFEKTYLNAEPIRNKEVLKALYENLSNIKFTKSNVGTFNTKIKTVFNVDSNFKFTSVDEIKKFITEIKLPK